jgi:hypothetical protein
VGAWLNSRFFFDGRNAADQNRIYTVVAKIRYQSTPKIGAADAHVRLYKDFDI